MGIQYFILVLAVILLAFAIYLYGKARALLGELTKLKDEISQVKNIGDLLHVTESTLEEAEKTIATARRVMDTRITKMEELLARYEKIQPETFATSQSQNSNSKRRIEDPVVQRKPESNPPSDLRDPDAQERELIARRNRQIILMLEDNVSLEEIAKKTGASMREINLIQKFIK